MTAKNTENTETKKKHNWKYDLILLAVLAVIIIGVFLYFTLRNGSGQGSAQGDGASSYYVQVEVNNRVEQLISIEDDGDYTFENIYAERGNDEHGENVIHIENGGVSMQFANCPDQVCVYQGIIEPGTIIPIVCMPNVVYVSIVAESDIDWSRIREEIVPEELSDNYAAYQESVSAG